MPLPPGVSRVGDEEEDAATAAPTPALPEGVKRVVGSEPSIGERASAFGQGAVRGVGEALPLILGGVGAGLGAVAGAPTGPGALATGAAGMTLGAGAGFAGRDALFDFFDVPTEQDLPPELRSSFVAGEFTGGAVPGAGAPIALGRAGLRTGGRFLDRVLETAATRPGTVAAAEGAAGVGSGIGAGVAEEAAPGNIPARIGAGIAGGVLSPAGLAVAGTNAVASAFNRVRTMTTRAGREASAASEIQRIVRENSEDPQALADAIPDLLRQLPKDAKPTAGQLTGSPALAALEREVGNRNAQFSREAGDAARNTLELLRRSADTLTADGSPAALKEAAELRRTYFSALLADKVQRAEEAATAAASRIGPTTPERVSEISNRAAGILQGTLREARTVERQLYSAVPDGAAPVENILAAADDLKANTLLPDESLPDLAEKFTRRMSAQIEEGAAPETVSSIRELRIFRSRMLDEARKASAAGDPGQARIYGRLAESALDDLDAVTEPGSQLDTARQFSRSLNDVFTRSFAGQADATTRTGASRVPPEILLRRAAGTGQEVGALRMRELNQAAQIRTPEGDLVNPQAFDELLTLQEQFLRNAAESVIDTNGQVSPRRLATFRRRNAELLEEFPELRSQLQSAESAQDALATVAQRTTSAQKAIDKRAAFAQVANTENPTLAVSRILNGTRPQEDFRQLAVLARRDSPAAVGGLQRAIMDDAMQRAGGAENFSFQKFVKLLTEPRRAGQPSPIEMMQSNGILDSDSRKRLETILQQGLRVETATANRQGVDELVEAESALFDLLARVGGVRIGGGAFRALGGEGPGAIVAAGRGSSFAQNVLEKVPQGKVMDVIIEAAQDPVLMQKLLARPQSVRERLQLGRELNALLLQRGITLSGPVVAGADDGQ